MSVIQFFCIIVLPIAGILGGLFFVYLGVKRSSWDKRKFKVKDLFDRNPDRTPLQFIIEGSYVVVISILVSYFVLIPWYKEILEK